MTEASERVQPFYCPYCGEEDFVPASGVGCRAEGGGKESQGFHCRSCDRRFVVRFLGLGAPAPVSAEGG